MTNDTLRDLQCELMARRFEINIHEIAAIGHNGHQTFLHIENKYYRKYTICYENSGLYAFYLEVIVSPSDFIQVKINDMQAYPCGTGLGTKVLLALCNAATCNNVTIGLESVPKGESHKKRDIFLRRLGFVPNGGSWHVRHPHVIINRRLDQYFRIARDFAKELIA